MLDERIMIKRLQSGDVTAIEGLYQAYSKQIYALSLSIIKNKENAEDVVSEVFIRLYRYLSSGKSVNNLKAFLFTICRNMSYDKLKALSQTQALPEEDILISQDMPIDNKLAVRLAINKLPCDEKEIVVLHCVSGFRHWEIADVLHLPEGTVRWKYHKALVRLKTELGGIGNEL